VWERLKPADIEQAKRRLAEKRAETLRRHAEELNNLDTDQAEIEQFARLVAGFAGKYLTASASILPPLRPEENRTETLESGEPSIPAAPRGDDPVPPRREVHHDQPSPNFEPPFRKLAGDSFSLAALISILGPSA